MVRSATDTSRLTASRPLLAALASAVVVAALAIGIALVRTGSPGTGPAAGSDVAAAIGYRWRLVSVDDARGLIEVPPKLEASIGFTRDGWVVGDDSVNDWQAKYDLTGRGFTSADPASTLAASAGGDPVRAAVIDAVDAVFSTVMTSRATSSSPLAPDGPPPAPDVTARVSGDTLTLRVRSYTLTLRRDGAQSLFGSASPTPSS